MCKGVTSSMYSLLISINFRMNRFVITNGIFVNYKKWNSELFTKKHKIK